MQLLHVEVREAEVDDLVGTPYEAVQQAVYVVRVRTRVVGAAEGAEVLAVRAREHQTFATWNRTK